MAELFADTSGFASLADPTQPFHLLAARLYRAARNRNERVVTTNYVIAELVALLTSPLRHSRSSIIISIDRVKASSHIEILHVDPVLDDEAWQLLKKPAGQGMEPGRLRELRHDDAARHQRDA